MAVPVARSLSLEGMLLRCLDLAATAAAWRPHPGVPLVRTLVGGRRASERVHAGFALVDHVAPGAARAISRRIARSQPLALRVDALELLGFGGGASVFRCDTPAGARVLKIFRRSLGRPLPEQRAVAAHYADRYRTVARWYADVPGLVLPTAFLVLPGPFLGRPVAAAVQPLIEGIRLCFFADLDDAAALVRLRADRTLAAHFEVFTARTLEAYAKEGRCLDLVGRENLMLVEVAGRSRLAVADCGILEVARLEVEAPERARQLAERVARLESLLARLGAAG
jgi:hypothetical protein